MPILWRYLLSHYLKVLFFCTVAFIAVLLTTRLDEIAHFATLGPQGVYIVLFTLHQIPYILPIAIPISGLISAIILIQNLSLTHELTALRASGLALRDILSPIFFASGVLAFATFFIVSELATKSHLHSGLLKSELRAVNPLLLLNNKHLMRLKGIHFDAMGPSRLGEFASQVFIAMPNKNNSRINVMLAKHLQATPSSLIGKDVTLISSLNKDSQPEFDNIIIENMGQSKTSIQDFSQTIQKKVWSLNNDHLKLSMLLVRLNEERQNRELAIQTGKPVSEQKQIQRNLNRCYSEICRRISVALAAFTFTLMGASFGVRIGRKRSYKGIFLVIGLASLFLIAYFAAKGIDHLLISSTLLYMVPHLVIIIASLWMLSRATKGIE